MDRQKTLLAVLAAVLLLLGARTLWPRLAGIDDGGGVARFSLSGPDERPAIPRLTELRLSDLELKPGEYHPGRDPFRFAAKPPPPAPPPPAPQPAPPVQVAQPPPRPQPAQPPAPTPPPVDVTYLGSFGPSNGKIAVFADGTDIYNVRKGDILKQHFLVESINYESADLKFVNFPTLPPTRLAAGG